MINSLDQIVYRTRRSTQDPCNFIYMPYDGLFENIMDSYGVPFNFYTQTTSMLNDWKCKDWPPSTFKFYGNYSQISEIPIDLILVNNRNIQAVAAAKIARQLHCPLLMIDHELPSESSNSAMRKYVNSRIPKETIFVSTHEVVNKEWCYEPTYYLPYGFTYYDSSGERELDVLVVGDYEKQDQNIVKQMMETTSNIKGVGFNDSTEPYSSFSSLRDAMRDAKICLMAVEPNKPPLLPLLAASQGCVVVTNKTPWTEAVFTDRETAILFDQFSDMKKLIKDIIPATILLKDIKNNAKKMMMKKFSPTASLMQWDFILQDLNRKAYIR